MNLENENDQTKLIYDKCWPYRIKTDKGIEAALLHDHLLYKMTCKEFRKIISEPFRYWAEIGEHVIWFNETRDRAACELRYDGTVTINPSYFRQHFGEEISREEMTTKRPRVCE